MESMVTNHFLAIYPFFLQKFEGDNFNDVLEALLDIAVQSNIFEKYGVDRYMTGYGLTADPEYAGFNVGQRILECRRPLCNILGIKATGTVFTGTATVTLNFTRLIG